MRILSIEFILGANEDAEDLEDESDRFSDRRIVVRYRDRHNNECYSEFIPISSTPFGACSQGNGQENFSGLRDRLAPWLHGGELSVL